MIHVDREFSQKLERTEARANVDFVETREHLAPSPAALRGGLRMQSRDDVRFAREPVAKERPEKRIQHRVHSHQMAFALIIGASAPNRFAI